VLWAEGVTIGVSITKAGLQAVKINNQNAERKRFMKGSSKK
jgi:hypothetical protein